VVNKEIVFVETNGKYFPTLRVIHKCMHYLAILSSFCVSHSPVPFLLPKVRVDTGAIKFVMGGANVMCPGMTSPGGDLSMCPSNLLILFIYLAYFSFIALLCSLFSLVLIVIIFFVHYFLLCFLLSFFSFILIRC
jgi:predicted RNA-binding protein (TIGR00451 family)